MPEAGRGAHTLPLTLSACWALTVLGPCHLKTPDMCSTLKALCLDQESHSQDRSQSANIPETPSLKLYPMWVFPKPRTTTLHSETQSSRTHALLTPAQAAQGAALRWCSPVLLHDHRNVEMPYAEFVLAAVGWLVGLRCFVVSSFSFTPMHQHLAS